MVLFAEALSEATTQGICEKTTLLENLWDFSSKNMVQFFHSKSVVNSILFVGKTWNFTRRGCIKDLLVSSSQIHKSMSRYHNKDIKILVALLPTLINSEVIEAAARNCCLRKFLPKISKNLPENTSAGVSLLKNNTKRENRNSSTAGFPWLVLIFLITQFFSHTLMYSIPKTKDYLIKVACVVKIKLFFYGLIFLKFDNSN